MKITLSDFPVEYAGSPERKCICSGRNAVVLEFSSGRSASEEVATAALRGIAKAEKHPHPTRAGAGPTSQTVLGTTHAACTLLSPRMTRVAVIGQNIYSVSLNTLFIQIQANKNMLDSVLIGKR